MARAFFRWSGMTLGQNRTQRLPFPSQKRFRYWQWMRDGHRRPVVRPARRPRLFGGIRVSRRRTWSVREIKIQAKLLITDMPKLPLPLKLLLHKRLATGIPGITSSAMEVVAVILWGRNRGVWWHWRRGGTSFWKEMHFGGLERKEMKVFESFMWTCGCGSNRR